MIGMASHRVFLAAVALLGLASGARARGESGAVSVVSGKILGEASTLHLHVEIDRLGGRPGEGVYLKAGKVR